MGLREKHLWSVTSRRGGVCKSNDWVTAQPAYRKTHQAMSILPRRETKLPISLTDGRWRTDIQRLPDVRKSSKRRLFSSVQFSSVQSLSRVRLFATRWKTACQASLSITNSQSLFKLMSIESVMPSNHLIFCCPLLLLPSIFPNIRVFTNESALRIRWPKYWSFSFNISPCNQHPRLISVRMDWLDLD